MTIKIEVTGESIAEVADKLLAIGGSLQGRVAPAAPAEAEKPAEAAKPAEKAKPTPKPKAAKEATKEDVGEPDAPTATDAATPTPEKTTPSASVSTAGEPSSAGSAGATEAPDYDSVVAPLVLDTVKRVGRDKVVALISEFGASKAAEIPDEQLADFVSRLEDLQ